MKAMKPMFAVSLMLAGSLLFSSVARAQENNDAQIQSDVMKALDKKQFKDVQAAVHDGVVTLTGTVDVYSEKEDADRKVHHRKNVKAVDNEIQVGCNPAREAGREARLRPCRLWHDGLQRPDHRRAERCGDAGRCSLRTHG